MAGRNRYVKTGLLLDDLFAEELRPRTLLEEGDDRHRHLMAAIDAINDKHGRWTVEPAIQGFRREWRMRAENRSPCWTTRIAEVPVVRA